MSVGVAACDNGTTDNGGSGPLPVGGSGNATSGGSGNVAGSAPAGGSAPTAGTSSSAGSAPVAGGSAGGGAPQGEGIPLNPVAGWVPVENAAMIQGAVFSFADPTSKMGMTDNLMDAAATSACIKGTAAKVDMLSTACSTKMFTPPAMDCYGEYWGAALGMNLNQVIDMTLVPPAGGTPGKYDASALKGFSFEISGETVPAPTALRFKVDNGTDEFCNVPTVKVKVGVNTVLFTDLVKECYKSPVPTEPLATTIQTGIVKISWQVVTNDKSTVPFDFCVSNIRALPK
jgi:hypothetical protein